MLVLWLLAEEAFIGMVTQEDIGSAIALQTLSRGMGSLGIGVILTTFDCFIILFLQNYGVGKDFFFFLFLFQQWHSRSHGCLVRPSLVERRF